MVRARALLSDALDQGASHDVALGVLGRIDRLDAGTRSAAPVAPAVRRRALARPSPAADANHRRGTIAMWWITAAAIVLVAAISFVLVAPNGLADWFPVQATTGAPAAHRRAAGAAAGAVADGSLRRRRRGRCLRAASCATRCARSIAFRWVTRCDRTPNVFVLTFNENCWPWPAPKRHRHRPSPLPCRHLANEVSEVRLSRV